MKISRILSLAPIALLLCLSAELALAGGVKNFNLPPITAAGRPVKIDGRLDEWQSVPATRQVPLELDPTAPQTPETRKLEEREHSALWRMCYDTEALYVAVEWKTATAPANSTLPKKAANWAKGGDGLELHLKADKVLHLACWPKASSLVSMVRLNNDANWKEASSLGIQSAMSLQEGGYVQEIRIPWKALTSTGTPPADGAIVWGADLVWKDLTPKFLRTLPNHVLNPNTHTTRNFLTSADNLYSKDYLQSVGWWGELLFADKSEPAKVEKDSLGSTGVTRMTAAKGTPAVDGDLKEWGNLPELLLAPELFGKGRYAARMGMRFDEQNLYFAAHYTAPLPVSNQMRLETWQGFRGGDCLQLRLGPPGQRIGLCAWYDSQAKRTALTVESSLSEYNGKDLLAAGAQLVMKPDAEGNGYTLEARVPWATFMPASAVPKSGDQWKSTFQAWWAGLEPAFTLFGGKTPLEPRGALAFNYQMPAEGEVSLGVYDKSGSLLRWLTRAALRPQGENTEFWDGLDQYGEPLPAGEYVVKALHHPPLALDYKLTVGNPGNPPWMTSDGKGDWLTDEATHQAAATDGRWVFLGAPGSEKGFDIIGLDEKGQKQWGFKSNGPIGRGTALAVEGDFLYVLNSGPELTDTEVIYDPVKKNALDRVLVACLEKRTGKPAKFSQATPFLKVATAPYREEVSFLWDLRRDMNFTPANYGGQPRYSCNDIGESTNALGIAAAGGRIYVSLAYENKIIVLNAETGERVGELPLAAPVGLHAPDAKTLYAVSGTQVVKFDLSASAPKPTPLITDHLLAPHSIATDKAGNLYVSDWKSSFQVKVFSPEGNYLRAIGKEGGRPWSGKWESDGMLVPRGIAVTDEGKLWVAEDDASPKRISVWDTQTGSFVKDYIGPTPYGGGGVFWIDPKDPTIGYALGTRFKLDYEKKTCTPLATVLRKTDRLQPFMPDGHAFHNLVRPFYHDGKEYIAYSSWREMFILQRKGEIFVPVAAMGGKVNNNITVDGTEIDIWDIGYHRYVNYLPEFFRGKTNVNYSWSDLNADGLVQAEEMSWVESLKNGAPMEEGRQAPWNVFWSAGCGADGSIYFATSSRNNRMVYRVAPQQWTPAGVPVYDIAKAKPIIRDDASQGQICGLFVNAENKIFVSYDYASWFGPVNKNALECYDSEGRKLWGLAMPRGRLVEKDLAREVLMENVVGDFTLPGIGNVIGTWLWHASFKPFLITSDGLYVGSPLDEGKAGPKATWDESFKFYYQAPDGTPYMINGGSTGDHLLQIKGLEKAGRFETPLILTEADAQKAKAMRNLPKKQKQEEAKPVLKVEKAGAAAPVVDGDLGDWDLDKGVTYRSEKEGRIRTALRRDDQNLYLAYEVEDASPLMNQGGNWQTLFMTGDCVDLMLGTNPKADPKRGAAVAGDVRLLLSLFQDQPIAVRYRPVVAGGSKNAVQLMGARLDEIQKLPSAKVSIKRGTKQYTLEASVPLADLGLDPKNLLTLRGDVGVIFSDASGRDRVERVYYYNKQTGTVSDLTTEATLQPREWGNVEFSQGIQP